MAALQISKSQLDWLCHKHRVPYFFACKSRRFRERDIEAFISGQETIKVALGSRKGGKTGGKSELEI